MLINEFDLELADNDEFLMDKPNKLESKFKLNYYWIEMRKRVMVGRARHFIVLRNKHQKGVYGIMPNFEIVIK